MARVVPGRRARGAAQRPDRGRPLPPGAPGEPGRDRRPPARHLGHPRPARAKNRPGVGCPPPAAARPGTAQRETVHHDVERSSRRRPERADPHRLDRQGGTPRAARHRPHRRAAPRRRAPAAPLQRLVRPLRHARTRTARRHHRSLVAGGARIPADRRLLSPLPRPPAALPRRPRPAADQPRARDQRPGDLRSGLPRRHALGPRPRAGKALRPHPLPTGPLRAHLLRPGQRHPQPRLRQHRPVQSQPGPRSDHLLRPLETGHRARPRHAGYGPESHHPPSARRTRRRGIKFLTLRMRSPALLRHIDSLRPADYTTITLDRPGPHNRPRVHEDAAVTLTPATPALPDNSSSPDSATNNPP